jgi:hypothetical protein
MVASVQVNPNGGTPTDDQLNAAAVASNPKAGSPESSFPQLGWNDGTSVPALRRAVLLI